MKLNLAKQKYLSESNARKIISILTGMMSSVDSVASQCLKEYNPDETYVKGQICLYNNYVWLCKTVTTGAFEETKWEKQSDEFTQLEKSDIEAMLNLSSEDIAKLSDILLDTEVRLDKGWSSSCIYSKLQQCLEDGKTFTLKEISKLSGASYKVVTSTSEMTSESIIYLLPNATTYDMYIVEENGTKTRIGDTTINLDNYFTKSEVEADFLKKTDADGKYATITTVDGKVDKTSIATTLSNTSTDNEVASAKVVYDNAIKNKSLKTYTSLEQLGLTSPVTVGEIFLAIPNSGSLAVISCDDTTTTVTDVPSGYGVLTIEKGEAGRFSILFKRSAGSSIASNELYVGQLKGSDGSGLKWGKVIYGDKTTVIDKNSTNDTVPTSLAVRNAMLGMNVTDNTTYGDDVLYFPCGIYKIVNNATAATLKNLPISSAGLLQVHSVNSHNSDLNTTTYVYRMYIFIPIGERDIYIRNISTGNTAGVFTADTGWKKVCTTKVKDVPKTDITYSDTTNYEAASTTSFNYFEVVDGVCYFSLYAKCNNPLIGTNGTINESLPKPRKSVFKSLAPWDNATDGVCCIVDASGTLYLRGGTVNGVYIGTFSYPVAES